MGLNAVTEKQNINQEKSPRVSEDTPLFKSWQRVGVRKGASEGSQRKIKPRRDDVCRGSQEKKAFWVKGRKLSCRPLRHRKDKDKGATKDWGAWPQDVMAALDKSCLSRVEGQLTTWWGGIVEVTADNPFDISWGKEQKQEVAARGVCGVKIKMG